MYVVIEVTIPQSVMGFCRLDVRDNGQSPNTYVTIPQSVMGFCRLHNEVYLLQKYSYDTAIGNGVLSTTSKSKVFTSLKKLRYRNR